MTNQSYSVVQSLTRKLTTSELPHLLNMLSPAKHKCEYIGYQLGVSDCTIQSITKQHSSHLDQLRDILRHRLNQTPHLSVQDIVKALKSRSVEATLLASEIESQYAHQVLGSASSRISTKSHLLPTVSVKSIFTSGSPTGALASKTSFLEPERERELMASSISNPAKGAYLPFQEELCSHQIQSQSFEQPTSGTYQHSTVQYPSHSDTTHPQHIPQLMPDSGLGTPPAKRARYTTPLDKFKDCLHQASHQQVSHYQSQHQDISDHVSSRQFMSLPPTALASTTQNSLQPRLVSPVDQFISYVKQTYRLSAVERNFNVIKWPPTPSKIFINLACIDWRTVVTRKEADEFTRAMVEDGNVDVIMKKKTPIEFSDIVQDLPDTALEKLILVEGAPGVGKSTFAWEFCRRWERGEIAQQYRLVLLLRLRDERMSKAKRLKDLLYHPKGSVCDAVEEHLIDTFGDKCLIILEGFDELPDTCRMESSIFLQLINGQLLPLATILVTSRPWATSALLDMCHHNIYKHIEILGFTETHIEKYVKSVFTDEKKAEDDAMKEREIENIMTYIATYPQIKACMYIPLNSAIVVSVYQESKAGRCILPKTLTQLYYALTQTLLLRYLRGHPVHSKNVWNIQSLENDLPGEVYKQLLRISEIAYTGICTDWGDSVQLIYSDLSPTFETLGLMQTVSQMYITQGMNVSHNFLHLTVQEFLAALHISNMSPKEQLKHFRRHKEGRFRVVLRFLAGLTKLLNISVEQVRGLLEPLYGAPEDMDYTQMTSDVSVCAHHLNWMFETQSSDVIKTWLQDKTVDFKFQAQMSPLEYYSAGYCIAHSSAQWVLTIEEDIDENAVKMFCTGTGSAEEADFKTKLRTLTDVGTKKLDMLLTNLGPCMRELYLRIYDSNISLENLSALRVLQLDMYCKKVFNLTTSIPSQSLESLTVAAGSGSNVLGLKSCSAIEQLLTSSKSLTHFHLSSKKAKHGGKLQIGSKGAQLILKAMAGNTSLQLRSVEFPFTERTAELLAEVITHSKFVVNLHIWFCHKVQEGGIESITKALADNTSIPLKRLIFPTLEISDTAADSLALFIQKCATLEFVSWEENEITLITACGLREMANAEHHYSWLPPAATGPDHHRVVNCIEDGINFDHIRQHHSFVGAFTCHNIGDKGACSFGASLIKNSIVRRLHFNSNHAYPALTKVLHQSTHQSPNKKISDPGATALAQALHHNSRLRELDLSNNSVSDAGATAVAQALHHNSTLRELDLSNNSASDAGATAVAQALHHNSTLRELDLSNNSVSDAGATAVAQALHHNSTLWKLDLSNNSVSDAGATAVAQALHHNSTLWKLGLSSNSITDAGVTAIAQALHHNSTLEKLGLSSNSITDAGVTAVAQALHHNSALWQLDLSNNSVSDAGTTAVAQAFHHNSALWQLDLSNNSVSDAGTTAVAQAFHHNSTLCELDLSNNSIGDAGATALAQGFHHASRSRLGGLNLSGNDAIHKEGTCELVHALTTCSEVWWTYYGGLVLPKRCEEFATQCPEYVQVKTRVKFV